VLKNYNNNKYVAYVDDAARLGGLALVYLFFGCIAHIRWGCADQSKRSSVVDPDYKLVGLYKHIYDEFV